MEQVMTAIGPHRIFSAAGLGATKEALPALHRTETPFTANPTELINWLK
jgi:hypothetical protein